MQRVLVIGSPGAGKSTLSFEVARRTGLPLIHLDQHAWLPGWIELDREEWKAQLRELVAGDRWLIDGNYGGSLGYRLTRADTVIDLDLPMPLCVARLAKRIITTHGRVRADMADGCPEQLDWGFLLYTARFPWTHRARINERLAAFQGRVIRLNSPAEVRRFLASLPSDG
jgi:adenylate kinase family enzyme